ncbi:MAG TPA: pyridoxal-phosphate dependent enzyme [Actinomycetes bacterium]|nr:pyridoxal-phosphate dependent enzyme [Actinomycetes bacterium]
MLPRFDLGVRPTPLVRAHRLEDALGTGPVLLKRDDLIGFAGAGNKARPLELIVGAALEEGADTLVTGGSAGSNFVHAAACAARVAGLAAELLIAGPTPLPAAPGLALAAAAGARIIATGGPREQVDAAIAERAEVLRAAGRRPMAVPRGGSTPLGAVGFALAVAEVAAQLDALDVAPALVVIALGSGGTTAGLLAGLAANRLSWPVLTVSVSRPVEAITAKVLTLAQQCADLLGAGPIDPGLLEVVDARDPAHGGTRGPATEAITLGLATEGLLLDPVYSGPAFGEAVHRARAGLDGPLLFWHTGGLLPAVAALADTPHKEYAA